VKEPPAIALVRVDNRLVHGQVLEAWLPALDAHGILVADDEAAGNVLARSAMALAIPPRVSFQVLTLDAAAAALRPGGTGPQAARTLLLLRDVRDAVTLRELGVSLPRLNVGNIHFGAGRRPISASVFLSAQEVTALEALAKDGTEVELRAVPGDAALPVAQIRSRFEAASG
jgi:PTS system mannose-specific IIB component